MGLIRLLVIALIGVVVLSIYRKMISGPSRAQMKEDERLGRLVRDPQCQVYVDSKDAVHRKVPGGELYFCSEKCAEEYMAAQQAG